MKYKALVTIFLLVLPMLMVPLATANNPPWNVELRIRPGATKFTGPCLVSTNFPIDVYLWNDKAVTGVGVYAYDFFVYWQNTSGISLVENGFVNHIPWPTGKYYLVKNETGHSIFAGWDFYHLAVTAIGNSTLDPSLELGATGLFNASLVTLTFHIDSEPFYPASFHADFLIGGIGGGYPWGIPLLSTGCTVPITNLEIDHGTYDLTVGQPDIDPEATLAPPYPTNITVGAIGVTETVYIHLTDITGAYGFYFNLTYNTHWKQTDIQHITILPAFNPPYESLAMHVDNASGWITVSLKKPSEKPTICSKDIAVVKIDFVSNATDEIGKIPYEKTTYFAIADATLFVKNTTWSGQYDFAQLKAVNKAADRLVALQSSADFGWDWIVTGLTEHSTAQSAWNTYGVTALDLIHAYEMTGNTNYLDAAGAAADIMKYGDPSAGDFRNGYNATLRWGMSFDYRFLIEYGKAVGDTSYFTYANKSWQWDKANTPRFLTGAAGLANFYWVQSGNEMGYTIWSLADWGMAFQALKDSAWANATADVIHNNVGALIAEPQFVGVWDTQNVPNLGLGKALEFFANSPYASATYPADITLMAATLKARKLPTGQWQNGAVPTDSVQDTAYAVMGLYAAGEDVAAQNGSDWLVATQLPNGGWLDWGREISEVDSEAMSALMLPQLHMLTYSGDLGNVFKPKSRADLNLDGAVDILDLGKVALKYGLQHAYAL
jgi:hypothetical protein